METCQNGDACIEPGQDIRHSDADFRRRTFNGSGDVHEAGQTLNDAERAMLSGNKGQEMVVVATKCDLQPAPAGLLATSAVTAQENPTRTAI